MPEGDAVLRTAQRLDRALAGSRLVRADLRVPRFATADLSGATVVGTGTYGKHLLTRLVTEAGERLTLHTHLKMEGSWRTTGPGARPPGPEHDIRVVLTTARTRAVGLRLGIVELLRTDEEDRVVGHLGPDLLGPWTDRDRDEAVARLTRDPERILGEALLDQTVVAGMGTIWVAETCFVSGISPLARVGELAHPDRLLARGRRMMQGAMSTGGPLTTGDRTDRLWVYRKPGRPCRRCGTTLLAGTIGPPLRERTTYWCPHCQPGAHGPELG